MINKQGNLQGYRLQFQVKSFKAGLFDESTVNETIK